MTKTNLELFRESRKITEEQRIEEGKVYKKIKLKEEEIRKAKNAIEEMNGDLQRIKDFYEMKKEKLWEED